MRPRKYIKKEELLEELARYNETGVISQKLGQFFIAISTNFGKIRSFAGLSYIEDMIGDGILDCTEKVGKFDITKSDNAFAYFTQIVKNAFYRRIMKEQNSANIKTGLITNMSMFNIGFDVQDHDSEKDYCNQYLDYRTQQVIDNYS